MIKLLFLLSRQIGSLAVSRCTPSKLTRSPQPSSEMKTDCDKGRVFLTYTAVRNPTGSSSAKLFFKERKRY